MLRCKVTAPCGGCIAALSAATTSFDASNRSEPTLLSADPPLQKAQHCLESAELRKGFVPGISGRPKLLWFRRRIEQRAAEAYRYDPIVLAVQNQYRGSDFADPGERVEAVPHHRRGRHEGIMILRDFGHAGERRFENQPCDLPLRSQRHSNPRSQ